VKLNPEKSFGFSESVSEFLIWTATYCDWNKNFDLTSPEIEIKSVSAGDEGNPAVYFIEHHYKKNPVKTVSGLMKMAAHVILTGHIFNPASVDKLEMVVGRDGVFTRVPQKDIQYLLRWQRSLLGCGPTPRMERKRTRFRG
jgi:hypothetical protein